MKLLVGLGNPGTQYERTRHNIGFMAVDRIAEKYRFSDWGKKFKGLICEGEMAGEKILALKPQTFMNLSGESVGECMRYYKIEHEDVIVFHDELELVPGKMRMKRGGGNAGHNGLKSLDQHIGKDYHRVRIGIGHPGHPDRVTGYVLGAAQAVEAETHEKIISALADGFKVLIQDGRLNEAGYMNHVALVLNPPPPKPIRKTEDGI
jgi:PTH1 family peptidyl-tRNA hydrolase